MLCNFTFTMFPTINELDRTHAWLDCLANWNCNRKWLHKERIRKWYKRYARAISEAVIQVCVCVYKCYFVIDCRCCCYIAEGESSCWTCTLTRLNRVWICIERIHAFFKVYFIPCQPKVEMEIKFFLIV